MRKLGRMAGSYYDGLPEELVTPQTQAYRGMALVREGGALLARGDVEAANPRLDEARKLFQKLKASGDQSEAVTLGLALSLFTRFSSWGVSGAPGSTMSDLQQAADLLRPLVRAGTGSRATRLVYADTLNYLSHTQPESIGIVTCEEARGILAELGALDLTDLKAASVYADTSDSQARHALTIGRVEDAERIEREVYSIAEKVLAQRPGDLRSMANRALAADLLGRLAVRRHDYVTGADFAAKSAQAGESYVRFNPSDLNSWVYLVRGKEQVAGVLFEQGRVAESMSVLRATVALEDDKRRPSSLKPLLWQAWVNLAAQEARTGQRAVAEKSLQQARIAIAEMAALETKGSARQSLLGIVANAWQARLQLMFGDDAAALAGADALDREVSQIAVPENDKNSAGFRANIRRGALTTASLAAIRLGRFADAERAARERHALPPNPFSELDPQEERSRAHVTLAHAVASQGRREEARTILRDDLVRYREEQERGARGVSFERDFAYALYVDAISQADDAAGQERRKSSLAAASRMLGRLSAEARQLTDVRELDGWIAAAGAHPGG
jgi:hypothetical protein